MSGGRGGEAPALLSHSAGTASNLEGSFTIAVMVDLSREHARGLDNMSATMLSAPSI